MITLKERNYCFVGKVKDLCKDIQEEMENREIEEIERGFAENMFCDNYGYCCGSSCRNYINCQGK